MHHIDEASGVAEAHCRVPGSPFKASGYILSEVSSGGSINDVANGASHRPKFRDALRERTPRLQAVLASALLRVPVEPDMISPPALIGDECARICGAEWQSSNEKAGTLHTGKNLIGLIPIAYPTTDAGMVGLRVLEAATGFTLPDEHRLAVWRILNLATMHGEGRR